MSQIKVGIIGGSGIADLLNDLPPGQSHTIETPFGKPSDAIIETQSEGLPLLLLPRHGPGHLFNPTQVPYRANIFALKQLGCTHIIATGAVGSLRQEYKPKDLVICDQVIDKTTRRPGTFYEKSAVHVEFAEPFCPVLRRILLEAAAPAAGAAATAQAVHDRACYVCMEGPAFSTRAESLMHRLWGGDLIGMTTMPEAKLAREAEISYALLALVTDYDSWKQAPPLVPGQPAPAQPPPADSSALLQEILGNLRDASAGAMALIRKALALIAANPQAADSSPARDALKLAIWSNKTAVDPQEVQRLSPLWGRYFR